MIPSLTKLVAKGESKTLEFKRSTGELREALQTIYALRTAEAAALSSSAGVCNSRPLAALHARQGRQAHAGVRCFRPYRG